MPHFTRRLLLSSAALLAAARPARSADKPALLGGTPIRSAKTPSWPVIGDSDERRFLETFRSRRWYRRTGEHVDRFEQEWAKTLGSQHALATSSGTTALWTAVNALGIGPGDEVIVPPYTFIATINAVLLQHALPVFVDTDPETFQMDASAIEAAVTPRTRAIIPVHLGGSTVDMDAVMAVAGKHDLAVIEDACQSHLAEWRGRRVGGIGDCGCFSFQASKNLNSGEGGALVTNDRKLDERARAFHNNGNALGAPGPDYHRAAGCNLRMTEFQGALLLTQLERLEEQARRRERNAERLSAQLAAIPGITPAKMPAGCTRNAYHLYMFRYDPAGFAGLPRERFLEALAAEGIRGSSGYSPLNQDEFLENTLASRAYQAIYSAKQIEEWRERNHCPRNEQLCEEAVWFSQPVLLGAPADMDQIAEAISRIQRHAEAIKQA